MTGIGRLDNHQSEEETRENEEHLPKPRSNRENVQDSEANIDHDGPSADSRLLPGTTHDESIAKHDQILDQLPMEYIQHETKPSESNENGHETKSGSENEKDTQQGKPCISPQFPLPLRKRLTIYLVVVIVASTISLLTTIGFLTFLWHGDRANSTWRAIVLANWTTRAVTLTALVMRVSVSMQAGIVTSMLASLIIEGPGVLLKDAPEISTSRFSTNGPHTFLWTYLRQRKSLSHTVLLAGCLLSSLAVQFSSTLLLSDVDNTAMAALASNSTLTYGFRDFILSESEIEVEEQLALQNVIRAAQDYWVQAPSAFQVFGEYSVPTKPVDGVDDTGLFIRSMIPISNHTERESLHSYIGPSFSYDARVVCTGPILSELAPCGLYGSICGQVAINASVQDLVTATASVPFNCSYSQALGDETFITPLGSRMHTDSSWTICGLNASAGGLISILDPTTNSSLTHRWATSPGLQSNVGNWISTNGNLTWPVDLGSAFLLLNLTTILVNLWNGSLSSSYSGPWTDTFIPLTIDQELVWVHNTFRASICFDAVPRDISYSHFQDLDVSLSSKKQQNEPAPSWESGSRGFDTMAVRRQLGVSAEKATASERGILELSGEKVLAFIAERRSEWTPPSSADVFSLDYSTGVNYNWFNTSTYPWVSTKVVSFMNEDLNKDFCLYCDPSDGMRINTGIEILQASTFNSVLKETGSPALALQAQLTILLRMAYYAWLPLFNAEAKVTTVSFVTPPAPVSNRGYWAVMGILSLHILCCLVTTGLFFTTTKYSLLGNAWSAFAQVAIAEKTQVALRNGVLATDDEVEEMLRKEGDEKKIYRVAITNSGPEVALTLIPTTSVDG